MPDPTRYAVTPAELSLMAYAVKECFYTLQGEGAQSGRPAVFLRFAGCNLWTGREVDRATAVCKFCDTDFVGIGPDGGKFPDAHSLAAHVDARWPADAGPKARKLVVCTGGEPLLQLDEAAIDALHARGFEVAVETNGTQPAPRGLDHICVSPKANAPLVLTSGTELKLVYPQVEPDAQPSDSFISISSSSACSRWTDQTLRRTRGPHWPTALRTRNGD